MLINNSNKAKKNQLENQPNCAQTAGPVKLRG
jgi:hypothetical protein